jgi:hypothetical protein
MAQRGMQVIDMRLYADALGATDTEAEQRLTASLHGRRGSIEIENFELASSQHFERLARIAGFLLLPRLLGVARVAPA